MTNEERVRAERVLAGLLEVMAKKALAAAADLKAGTYRSAHLGSVEDSTRAMLATFHRSFVGSK